MKQSRISAISNSFPVDYEQTPDQVASPHVKVNKSYLTSFEKSFGHKLDELDVES